MWDSNAPLQLLKSMPKKLSKENLEKIQLIIDADKYKNNLISGFDLCGMYAPFCRGCNKTSIYPCAVAYVNMMKAQGMDIEIDAKPVYGEQMASEPVNTFTPVVEQHVAENHPEAHESVHYSATQEIAVTNSHVEAKAEEAVAEHPVRPEIKYETHIAEEEQRIETPHYENAPAKPQAKRKIRIAVARKKIL